MCKDTNERRAVLRIVLWVLRMFIALGEKRVKKQLDKEQLTLPAGDGK